MLKTIKVKNPSPLLKKYIWEQNLEDNEDNFFELPAKRCRVFSIILNKTKQEIIIDIEILDEDSSGPYCNWTSLFRNEDLEIF